VRGSGAPPCDDAQCSTLALSLVHVVQMHKYFSFEIEALDDKKLKRRFRASNYQVRTPSTHTLCFLF
jgi:hypothetical protein